MIEEWRQDYNAVRPHSSLDDLTPEQFRDRTALPWALPVSAEARCDASADRPGLK
jgi:hypothetical protein